jgi:DNA-binding CsgD family transcriptional regulator
MPSIIETHLLRKAILILVIVLDMLPVFGQVSAGLNGDEDIEIKHYEMVPDHSYSFERILTDTTLAFVEGDSLRPLHANQYWFKIKAFNGSRYAQSCILTVLPNMDNTLFYFNEDVNSWITQRAGINVATDKGRVKGQMHLILQGHTATTLYVQVNLGRGYSFPKAIRPQVILEKESVSLLSEQFVNTAWIVSLAVLLMLFLNNLHVYYRFRDRSVLFFLFTLLGGMIYITAYRSFFKVVFPSPSFSLLVMPNGTCHSYSLNNVFMHLSVAIILYGFVQMARSYLQTKTALPKWDTLLRYSLYGYLLFTVVVALVNLTGFYLNAYTIVYDNILVLVLTGLVLATSIVAYRRNIPSATAYLFANMLPLLLLMSVALYHVLIGFHLDGKFLLPDLVIVSLALCFSIAIVSRIKILQKALLAKEKEAHELALNIGQEEFRHRELMLEKEQIQAAFRKIELERKESELETHQLSEDMLQQQSTNKDLQEKLEANQRELASTTLYMVQKNAMLAELKRQIEELNKLSPNNKHKELSGIKSVLQSNLYLDEDWNKFKLHFEQVHPHFFEELQAKYPALTKNELRLLSYFHLNLSTKEIAALLNIDPASVRTAKTRLYKKMRVVDKGLAPKQSDEETNEPTTGE